ncbi:Heparanase [Trachymyrmex zeteki]|uniref:Heparanase n=1 Tax=Mycetomoellerius zeteki TaxID=64791 RepID=A0A151WEY1_9HYME|nr:Heparanase [Trachymyrmex zeteki]
MKCHRQYVCLLWQVIFFITNCLAENLILNINVKKAIAVTDQAFLSFTLDPATLQYNDFIKNIEKSTNLARGLAPAYIRLGGPQSNFYNFEQIYSHEINTDRNDMHFGTQWTLIYQWAKNAGLDVIACITPHYINKEFRTDSRDPRNIAELLSFSDRMGYNISWQLGYECQTRCDLSGEELGRYVANLFEILKTFPRYSNSLITGPDIVAYRTAYQQKYLQDYLHSASAALSAITWHPNLDSVSLSNNSISIYYDNMIAEKDELFKIINSAEKKPLWIAESKSQESKHQYLGAFIWMRRLGDAAKLGIQVVMRQLTNLSQATPAYWISLLYKTLVGREVLEIKLQSNNDNYVHFYSHCTKPSALYSKGSVTIFGINLTPKIVTTSLKGLKIKILHKYILLPQFETTNKMFSELTENTKKDLNNMRIYLKEDSIKKIFDTQPMTIYLLTKKGRSSNAGLFQKLKNYLISLRKDFKVNQQNQKEYDLTYITPIEIKNIFEILDTKNNNDSMESFEIPQWDNQYVFEAILDSMTEYLNDKTSEEFEYEDPSNPQSENSEIFLDEENYIYKNKQDVTAKGSEIESEKDEQYKITNDEINKFFKIENQTGSKRGMFLLLPWRNVKIRQQRQIKSEINEDLVEIKREVTEDPENKSIKRYCLNNNIDKEEENMIETKRVNRLQSQTKNHNNLLEDFIKACKKNNLYNNETSFVKNEEKNETISLNNISKSDKKILQKEMPRLQNHMESVEEFVSDTEENFNDTLVNEDEHYRNRTFGTTGNVFYTAIMNIKDFFAFLPKISRLSTILPYPSLYNDEHLIKDNSKRSLILLMPVPHTQNKHEKSKEMVQKTKRCGTRRRNRFLLLSTKENNNRTRPADENINVGTSQQNSDDHTTKNAKHSQKNSATSKRMVADINEDKTLLRPFNDNLNAKDIIINLKFPEKAKKCNKEKYICHCEEDCSSNSSKENSSNILGSSKDELEKINHQRKLIKHENAKANILQQQSPKLYYENPYELPFSNLFNYFPIQPYPEKMNIPPVPVLYGITPNVLSHMVGNEGKYVDVGIPFISFQDRPNYLFENNEDQPIIHKKPCICSPMITNSVESSMSVTNSPSTDYVDAITSRETINDLESNNPIGITEEDQEHSPKLTTEVSNVDASADSETETYLNLNYLTDATEENNTISPSNLNKVVQKSNDFTEQTERNLDDLSKLTTYSTDGVDISNIPFATYDVTNNGKFINKEECIKLFGRDVCVLNKLKATDPYFASKSSTNEINKSNVNVNEYLESTSIKSSADIDEASLREFHQYPESTKQISESDINYDKNTPFNTVKNTHTPIKKLMDPTIDETTTTGKSKLLGKSKSHKTKLLLNPNDEEIVKPTSSKKFLYSTPSYESNSDEEANNSKTNQQNQVTNIKSKSNTSQEETTIVISYDSKTDPKKQDRNYLKEPNANIYSKKKILQEHFEEETTTSSNFKTRDNFAEETKKEIIYGIKTSKTGEIPQEQSTTMQYFDDKKSNNSNNKESTSDNIKTTDSSTNKLPFCDNTLLLNSIRKVINDFTLDTRLTKDFDENILQTQGKNLLPEILQVPNLKDILSMPQIENTIVNKVKAVLSYVTAIPRKDFTNNWSHGVIKNTLHSMLDALSGHHKLSPMMLEEHQFKDGQWKINLVTLAPILDQKLSIATPKNLREIIKELLNSPAIASQIDQNVVRNIIVQSVKNNLSNDENDKIDDLIIHALNDILQMSKNSENIDALEESNEVISDQTDMDMTYTQEIPTNNYEIGRNVDNSILNSKQNVNVKKQDTKIDNKEIHTKDNQIAKTLENNTNILTTSEFPKLLQLYEKKEKEESTNEDKVKEGILKKIDEQDDAEKKIAESLQPKIIYHKAILQNNLSVLEPNSTGAGQYIKNHPSDKESNKETTTIMNILQETPNYVSDNKILENIVDTLNENTLTTTTNKIDPLIILERIKFNLPPIKYYSPEILKYATNRIDDKNVEITTAPTNFMQKPSSYYAQDDTLLQNTAETKEENETECLTTTGDNLISSTNREYKPTIISLTDNILEPQQQNLIKNNIIKIHEVTTEIQRTYAKTTYFKAGLSGDDSSRTNSPSLTGETTNIRINNDNENSNGNSDNDDNNLINKMNNNENIIKAKEVIISSSKSSAVNDIYSPQLFPSSIASNNISELQRSQLYYINDGVKLPLEIKRLEDGSYALSISKNVCEQILTRKCPCCVPLQGHIVRSLKNHQQEDMHAMTTGMEKKDQENILGSNGFQFQPLNTVTRRNALKTQNLKKEEEEKERINEHHLWKPNDDKFSMISMPVIDFAKKYNLSLDFNEERVLLHKTELQNKILNYNKSIVNSSKIDQELKLPEVENTNDVQNVNIVQKINSENQGNSVLKEINISEESKMSKEEEKWDKLLDTAEGNKVFHEKANRKLETTKLINNNYNVPENFRENIEKPYRYQRNANYDGNKGTEIVKSMLYWLKGLFVDN